MRYLIFCFCLVILRASSCSKDDARPEQTRSKLIVGTWKATGFTASPAYDYDNNGTVESDIYAIEPACDKDNLLKFADGNVFQIDEGAAKCDANTPQVMTDTWSLFASDTKLKAGPDTGTILQLDRATLKLSSVFPDNSGRSITATFTYARQ